MCYTVSTASREEVLTQWNTANVLHSVKCVNCLTSRFSSRLTLTDVTTKVAETVQLSMTEKYTWLSKPAGVSFHMSCPHSV